MRPGQGADGDTPIFDEMVGRHPSMRRMFELIDRISFGNANVLVTGESGAGK